MILDRIGFLISNNLSFSFYITMWIKSFVSCPKFALNKKIEISWYCLRIHNLLQTASTTFLQFSFSCCVVKNMKSKINDLVSTEKVYHHNLRNGSLMNDSNIWPLLSWSVWVLWPWRKCICTLDKNMDCIKRNSLNTDIFYICFCCLIRSLPNFDSRKKTLYRSNHLSE